jgi:hypothetical protein
MAKVKKTSKKRKEPEPDPEYAENSEPEDDEDEPVDEPEGEGDEEADEQVGEEGDDGEEGGEDEEEDEEDEEEDEGDAEKKAAREAKKAAKKKSNQRSANIRKCKSAKSKGYRRLAIMTLTGSRRGTVNSHNRPADLDVVFDTPITRNVTTERYKNAFTLNAVNRMCKFLPENVSAPCYGEDEFKLRTALHNESLGREAANVVRANLEPIVHKILTKAVMARWDAGGKPRIGAYDIHVAARELLPLLDVSSSFSIGVIRNAQVTPEPKFIQKTKTVNGEKKKFYVPRDPERKILDLTSKEVEMQQEEIAEVKKQRSHAKKTFEAKQKTRDDRKNKRQKPNGGQGGAVARASGGAAVAPIV